MDRRQSAEDCAVLSRAKADFRERNLFKGKRFSPIYARKHAVLLAFDIGWLSGILI